MSIKDTRPVHGSTMVPSTGSDSRSVVDEFRRKVPFKVSSWVGVSVATASVVPLSRGCHMVVAIFMVDIVVSAGSEGSSHGVAPAGGAK